MQGVKSADPVERDRSWEALVKAYWKPAYKHLRIKWKAGPDDARDSVQGFFERALERDFFDGYDPAVARFRTFFKLCLDRHQSNAVRARARGGKTLDFAEAEAELERAGAAAYASPDDVFDREWRRQLFADAVSALEARCSREGKGAVFAIFRAYDLSEPPRPRYEDLAATHGLPVTTVTNHLAWARRTLRANVLEALLAITATERELDDETREAGL